MSTSSWRVDHWTGTGDPDEWPYPTQYAQFQIDGDLADRVRLRTGIAGTVFIVEKVISTGYSEYTVDTDYEFDVIVHDRIVASFDKGWSDGRETSQTDADLPRTSLAQLQAWLDEPDA